MLIETPDIVITKPDKGSGVVVMDKEEYLHLLAEMSINDATKFRLVDPESHQQVEEDHHPLPRKEKELESMQNGLM